MAETMTRPETGSQYGTRPVPHGGPDEAQKHAEGPVARGIEHYTAQMPSDWFLWAGLGSIVASLTLHILGRKEDAQFVGHWAPTFLILGVYNKVVKVAGSDRTSNGGGTGDNTFGGNGGRTGTSQGASYGTHGTGASGGSSGPSGGVGGTSATGR
jgi:hypothetical protein